MGHDTIVVRRKCLGVCRKSLFLILSSYSFPCSAWERYSGAPRQMSLPFSCAERRISVPTETVGTRNSHNRYLQSRCSMVVVHFLLLVQKKTNQKKRTPRKNRLDPFGVFDRAVLHEEGDFQSLPHCGIRKSPSRAMFLLTSAERHSIFARGFQTFQISL